jgi:uncharacterized protein
VPVRELFRQHPQPDDDSYPLRDERIDLEPMVREVLSVELPLAPHCDEGCKGLCPVCGADRNRATCGCETQARDPRWAALDALREDTAG